MDTTTDMDASQPKLLWEPSRPESSRTFEFKSVIERRYNLQLLDYEALRRWSVDNISAFWEEVWQFTGVHSSKPYRQVGDRSMVVANAPCQIERIRLSFERM